VNMYFFRIGTYKIEFTHLHLQAKIFKYHLQVNESFKDFENWDHC